MSTESSGPSTFAGPSLAGDDLPVAARERLAAGASTWTSDLSVAELALLRRAGFEPLGMAVGLTVYQIALQGYGVGYGLGGYGPVGHGTAARSLESAVRVRAGLGYGPAGYGLAGFGPPPGHRGYWQVYACPHVGLAHPPGFNYEDQLYERAVADAFGLAATRLLEETAVLGGHGVVGVRHVQRRMAVSASAVPAFEVKLIGTAVRRPGARPLPTPFTSHLSVQQFVKLLSSGFVPASLVMGVGAVRSLGGCVTAASSGFAGGEFRQRSDAVQHSRHISIAHLEASASGHGEMVVGVAVRAGASHGGEGSMLAEMLAVGTAVSRFRSHDLPTPPMAVLRLAAR
ncbi:MAG: hypothetical protein M0035_03250 [Actinomycetota bacterium]|nr:hypothetical protein [Actinomycetota bacterium]